MMILRRRERRETKKETFERQWRDNVIQVHTHALSTINDNLGHVATTFYNNKPYNNTHLKKTV